MSRIIKNSLDYFGPGDSLRFDWESLSERTGFEEQLEGFTNYSSI